MFLRQYDLLEQTSPQQEKHYGDDFVCEFCDKVFSLNIAYKQHIKNHELMNNVEEFKDNFYTFVGEKETGTISTEDSTEVDTNDSKIVSIAISKSTDYNHIHIVFHL